MPKVTVIPCDIKIPPQFTKIRVAVYCRVSTDSLEQSSSLETQVDHYTEMIEKNPFWDNAGIFAEHATGLSIRERPEFLAMMRKCRKKTVDLILTKSTSRFGRNTLDMLRALQELHNLGIDVYFELENLWLHENQIQLILAIHSAFAQAESESKSHDIKWGIRQGFKAGTSGYASFACYGYKSMDGKLVVDEDEAPIVRKLFEMRTAGSSLGAISKWLYEMNIPSPTGKEHWSCETINKLLKNEKYTGDVLLQKTFVKDLFSGKQVKNIGQMEQTLIKGHHPAIV